MNTTAIKEDLKLARSVAQEEFGENPPPEAVAAVMNAITAQRLDKSLETMADTLCRAAAVAASA